MSYIRQEDRDIIDEKLDPLIKNLIVNDGELIYIMYKLILGYYAYKGFGSSELVKGMGILECVKQEFYRRIIAPIEDSKMKDNGDIRI